MEIRLVGRMTCGRFPTAPITLRWLMQAADEGGYRRQRLKGEKGFAIRWLFA